MPHVVDAVHRCLQPRLLEKDYLFWFFEKRRVCVCLACLVVSIQPLVMTSPACWSSSSSSMIMFVKARSTGAKYTREKAQHKSMPVFETITKPYEVRLALGRTSINSINVRFVCFFS